MMDIENQTPKLTDQEEPYTLEDITATISNNYHSVQVHKATLQISDEGFTLLKELTDDQWLTIYTTFANTTSIGSDKTSLMIFVGDIEVQQQQQMPQILQIIQNGNCGNVILSGDTFTVTLDLSSYGKNVLNQVNDLLVKAMGEADDHQSKYDEDEQFDDMISADNIDENGAIIGMNGDQEEQEEEEEEDEKQQQGK